MTADDLRKIPTFRRLSDVAARILLDGAVERAHPSGTRIWRQGSRPEALCVLLAGTARAVRSRGGRETVVHHARAGDTLGEIPLFDGGPLPASLLAESPVRILLLDGESVKMAMAADIGLALTFLESLGRRVRDLAWRLETRMADPVRTRLIRFLLTRAGASSRRDFDLGTTQAHLAHDLGTVREVVARHLGDLVKEGLLERSARSRFRVLDGARLKAMMGD